MCCLSSRLVTLTTEPPWSHLVWTRLAHSPGGCICSQKPPSFSPGTPVLLLLLRAQTSALCLFQSCWADFCLAFSPLLTGSLTLGFSLHAGGSMAWLLQTSSSALTWMGQKKVDPWVQSPTPPLPCLLHGQVLTPPSRPLGGHWDGVSMAGAGVHDWMGVSTPELEGLWGAGGHGQAEGLPAFRRVHTSWS